MTKNFSKLLFLSILFLIFPALSLAEVSQINFVTDPQSIKPSTLSLPLTIQTQDAGGASMQTPETLDLQFISSSATGQFLNSSGDPVTSYMSKNTANKTFYYKDPTQGNFNITVNIRGRDSGVELTANQQIIISADASVDNGQNYSGEVLGDSTTSSSNTESNATYVSSPNSKLEVVAGSDRTTLPGSPIWFQATIKKSTMPSNLDFNWSFGDGNVGIGALVSHTYKYPGDYVVVLSTRVGDIFSISRLKVKVMEANMSVVDGGEYLEISNNSNSETNLFNWKIENAGKGFIFQPNTIILPKSSLKVDKSLLTMKGLDNSEGTVLKNYLGQTVFSREVSEKIDNLKKEISMIQSKIVNKKEKVISISDNLDQINQREEATSTQNLGDIIYESPVKESLMAKLTNFIKRVFSK